MNQRVSSNPNMAALRMSLPNEPRPRPALQLPRRAISFGDDPPGADDVSFLKARREAVRQDILQKQSSIDGGAPIYSSSFAQKQGRKGRLQAKGGVGGRISTSKSVSPFASNRVRSMSASSSDGPLSSSMHEMDSSGGAKPSGSDRLGREKARSDKARRPHSSRSRQRSPHPVDVMKIRAAAAANQRQAEEAKQQGLSGPSVLASMLGGDQATADMALEGQSPEVNGLVDPTSPLLINSPETATELRSLIESMQEEFNRLRTARIQAESRADQLEADLASQADQIEMRVEALTGENERMASQLAEARAGRDEALTRLMNSEREAEEDAERLRAENQELRKKLAKMRRAKSAADADALAARQECLALRRVVEAAAAGGGRAAVKRGGQRFEVEEIRLDSL